MLLGLVVPSLYMMATWTRFLFIGSMSIALMAGVGLVEAYELLKARVEVRKALALALGLLVLIPAANALVSVNKTLDVKPLINEHWEKSLQWLRENSRENDVVLAWWDYGHWITYYARRSPVAQGSPNSAVALYYLGKLKENWAMNLGVDYVIVSYYDFLKFGTIVETANRHPKYNITEDYALIVLPLTSSAGALIFQSGPYSVVAKPGKEWEVVINAGGQVFSPKELYVETKEGVESPKLKGSNSNAYLYLNLNYGYAVLMNEEAFNTTLVKLFVKPEKPYETVYSDGGIIKILKLEHPNVWIEKTNGEVIFHFENATGTGLGIFGFLDNGTMVFKKWYTVKGKGEFVLPGEVQGVVIRYTYVEKKKVVDRGVFRR